MKGERMDLTGRRFGRLTVLRFAGSDAKYRKRWECRCDCGKLHVVDGADLVTHGTRSCGCLRKDRVTVLGLRNRRGYYNGGTVMEGFDEPDEPMRSRLNDDAA